MPEKIRSFTGTHRFLSNFHPAPVLLDGVVYPTVEHAFQAAKARAPIMGTGVTFDVWFEQVKWGARKRFPEEVIAAWPPAEWQPYFAAGLSPHTALVRDQVRRAPTAGEAKRLGGPKGIVNPLRGDWDQVKIHVMLDLLRSKFRDPQLAGALLDTGDADLEEGNHWHDNWWGNCTCRRCAQIVGLNWLGCALMVIRSELHNQWSGALPGRSTAKAS